MPNDATFELMAEMQNRKAAVSLIEAPRYNIDDMDGRTCMVSLIFTGCYCLCSDKTIDPARPGMIYIDDVATEAPLIPPPMPMFGQMIGIHVRKYLLDYDRSYRIRFTGAYDTEGIEIPEFTFDLKTLPRTEPGQCYPEHDRIVLQAAREGAVLLKNDNKALPLAKGSTVNVFGAGAVVFRLGCLGAGKINPRYGIRVKEGIEKYSSLRLNQELYGFYTDEKNIFPSKDMVRRAKEQSDTAVIFLTRGSSEAHDMPAEKGGYYLTDDERTLIAAVSAAFQKKVVVLNVAYPIETGWVETYQIDAVLLMGLPGMAGGRALAEILEGKVNPSGKLPNTWAVDYWDYPSAKNFLSLSQIREHYPESSYVTTVYEEGLYVGYRYFDTFSKKAAWMFGHGLSYTTFSKTIEATDVKGTDGIVRVRVVNTGECPGKEVVQLYARLPEGELEQPDKRLVAFAKTKELIPGESQIVTLRFGARQLRSFDERSGCWVIEAGWVEFLLGGAPDVARPIQSCKMEIPETIMISQTKHRLSCPVAITELSKKAPEATWPKGEKTRGYVQDTLPFATSRKFITEEMDLKEEKERLITFPEVVKNPKLAEEFIAQMSDYELARFSVGGKTGWGMEDTGFAGMLYAGGKLEKYQIPEYYFADGNNGLNLFKPNIGFPVSTTICASWNEELSYQEGISIAQEAKERNLDCLLAPGMNLQRNPLCGRHTEYFSEDPLLAGRMAGQESRGFETAGISSCMKHFFGNNAETMRNRNHSLMTERTARELYLAAFTYAFDVHMPDTVMTGYNAVNGCYCADDEVLLRGILRDEMGFDGFVMTDWGGYGDQGMAQALAAGICWLAPGGEDDSLVEPIWQALENGTLSRAKVRQNLVRLIQTAVKYRQQ